MATGPQARSADGHGDRLERMVRRPFSRHGTSTFVDQYDEQFSRDIEPMKGGHGDNFYYQLVTGIRRYKGVPPIPPVSPRPIRSTADLTTGKPSSPSCRYLGDTAPRNHPGVGKAGPYVNKTGRNDLAVAKVSWDETNIYFFIRTRQAITPHTDPNWMLLFIDVDGNPATGWLGYDFVVNRTNVRPGHDARAMSGRLSLGCAGRYSLPRLGQRYGAVPPPRSASG